MMVVLGILVLLAGIVYTGLAPAREKARQAVCASNLRQIHQALMMYAADYGGSEPDGPKTYWQLGLPQPLAFGLYGNGGPFTEGYLKDSRVWICPDDPCTFRLNINPECRSGDPRRCCESYVVPVRAIGVTPGIGTFQDVVAQCGERFPLLYCPYHGETQGASTYILVLRWSGRVQSLYRRDPWTPCVD
jgi:type II secretory pathway pseudopilin PulG